MTNDLLEAALAAVRSYWDGSDKSKIDLRSAMTDLRCAAFAEQKRRQQEETTTLHRARTPEGGTVMWADKPPLGSSEGTL